MNSTDNAIMVFIFRDLCSDLRELKGEGEPGSGRGEGTGPRLKRRTEDAGGGKSDLLPVRHPLE